MVEYAIIVACTPNGGIGKDNTIPWKIPEDMRRFKEITTRSLDNRVNAVIMGRKTWESLPKFLQGRINVVVSKSLEQEDVSSALVVKSLDEAHKKLKEFPYIGTIFVIGGQELYKEAIYDHRYTKLYLTMIFNDVLCDRFFPIEIAKKRYEIGYMTNSSYHGPWKYQYIDYVQSNDSFTNTHSAHDFIH